MAPTIGVNLRVTGHCNQGSRKYMEDMFSVAYQQTEDELDLEYAYFGIFDGHGGHEAATFAKEHLMKAIVSQPGFWSDNDKDVVRAIKDGFIATHYAMWRNLENWPKTQSGWPSTSGTTASIAFIRRSNIYIGHVGDSCIVLGYQDSPFSDKWKGAALTHDHKPENPTELERISQAGGMVVQKSGVPRVVWHRPRLSHKGPLTRSTHIDQIPFLAVARSLGDLWSYNADSDRFVVSPEPDVSVHHIDLTRDRCLIFGTDGLWNMVSPNEAVSIVREAEFKNKSCGNEGQEQVWLNPSKCLVDCALNKWMEVKLRADNTSAVTLLLDPLGPPQSHVLGQQSSVSNLQSEFVPYYIESYKVNENKCPTKLLPQSSGLAICRWYPYKNLYENLNRGDDMTTLSAMEELFGKKVEIFESKNTIMIENKCIAEQSIKDNGSGDDNLVPSTSKTSAVTEQELKKLPQLYSTVLKNTKDNSNVESVEETPVKPVSTETNREGGDNIQEKESAPKSESDENDNQEVDENVNKMKLRGSFSNKTLDRVNNNNEVTIQKNYQNPLQTRSIKRNGRRGKKRKNYDVLQSDFNFVRDGKVLRSTTSKRRHSSLLETMNLMYEPKPKRRTRSEDQKKLFDCEEYKSDTENKIDGETSKCRKSVVLKSKSSKLGKSFDINDEKLRENHLQERLQQNKNSSSNSSNNSNSNNNSSKSSSSGSAYLNSSAQDFTPMRLRSTMPVKTLRSRNVNLEFRDWIFLNITKSNFNSRLISKLNNIKTEEQCDSGKNLTKMSILTRSTINSTKIQENNSPDRTPVSTRSHNKRIKK